MSALNEEATRQALRAWVRKACTPAADSLAAFTTHQGRRPGALWFPVVNLVWLLWMVGAPWAFGRAQASVVAFTAISLLVFLLCYQRAWFGSRRWLPHWTLAIGLLGLAIVPINSSWSYIIYAGSLLPFCFRGWRNLLWLLALLAAFCAVALASGFYEPWLLLSCVFTTAVVAALNTVYRHNAERDAELWLNQEAVRRLAVTAERERIGRDLHDLLGHTLSVVALKSELARRLVQRDAAAAERELADIERVAREALLEVRQAVTGMRAAALAGEVASARLLLQAAEVDFECECAAVQLAPEAESALALGLREAITNVQRHARATRVQVHLRSALDMAELSVQDNGRGAAVTPGNGLAGMQERLTALGGQLLLESTPGQGTLLRMQVPQLQAGAA